MSQDRLPAVANGPEYGHMFFWRELGESVTFTLPGGDVVRVVVADVRRLADGTGYRAHLAVDAPRRVPVDRMEVWQEKEAHGCR